MMIELKKNCCACMACKYICPQNAIEMKMDRNGFYFPYIDEDKCTNCGLCKKNCEDIKFNIPFECYAAINKNDTERKSSASGGIFPLLAQYTFEKNGVVCGALYDDNMNVKHDFAMNMKDAQKFKGSKYVRSDTSKVFEKIKEYLENGVFVLFTGTPCQVKGVKSFLKKDYDNLLLCDLICHSNPPQKIFSKYIKYLEKIYNKRIIDFSFRDKSISWDGSNCRAYFEDGSSEIADNVYSKAFLAGAISYESCYECKYSGIERVSDITIGDFWGVEKLYPEFYDKDGVSLILVNTQKGKKAYEFISSNMKIQKISAKEALMYNHNSPIKRHENYYKIFKKVDSDNFIKYLKKYLKTPIYKKVLYKLKRIKNKWNHN